MNKEEKRIAIYNIESDGGLNGIYINELADDKICYEIARKNKGTGKGIVGTYECMYFESNEKETNLTLTVELDKKNKKGKTYKVTWEKEGGKVFCGTGYKISQTRFAVRYEEKK